MSHSTPNALAFRPGLLSFCQVFLLAAVLAGLAVRAGAEAISFDLPSQPAAQALLAFNEQAKLEVLFHYDELSKINSSALHGSYEPAEALAHLLNGTGFAAHRNSVGKFIVARAGPASGTIRGRVLAPDGTPLAGLNVTLPGTLRSHSTDRQGGFSFSGLPPGNYQLNAAATGYRPLQVMDIVVPAGGTTQLEPQLMRVADEFTRLDPYIVQGHSANLRPFDHSQTLGTQLRAAGNLDLPRSENGALPYIIYDRDQLARSGVVDLNDFLQRELLESDAATHPPASGTSASQFITGSTNLNLRGYGADETIILVNGRRLPELLTTGSSAFSPDVNLIPLGLVQQVEVLPVSASSIYTGNAVGGVINIVLRPEADTNSTEITTTYTNALRGYDAPQSSVSLLHARALLEGRLMIRLSAYLTHTVPPTEMELRYRQSHNSDVIFGDPVYRATPNIRSADRSPLFGPGTSYVTSVAPGADGNGGLAGFAGRAGLRNLSFFDSPGPLSVSSDSLDYPYGLLQTRRAFAGSMVYDFRPWLQLGVDGVHSSTIINRGADVFRGDLTLKAANPLNPFGRDVYVSLNETAPSLGQGYNEARINFTSAVLGLLIKLPSDWKVALDGQYAHNMVDFRGLSGIDSGRWQQLVDRGRYNPLRDTQTYGAPDVLLDQALIYLGGRDRFVRLGDYETMDAAFRVTNQFLELPTGPGVLNAGADYRLSSLARYTEERRFSDGSFAETPIPWSGRTLQRYSLFGELQASLLPAKILPSWIRHLDGDVALRYIASANAKESNLAPTLGLKLETETGLSFRTSLNTSSRIPTPQMSLPRSTGGSGGLNYKTILDPRLQQRYDVQVNEDYAPALATEDSVTQTAGVIYQTGKIHRFRAALDFADTRKSNEVIVLEAQDVANLEAAIPVRLHRDPATGRIASVLTGAINTDSRHSQNWSAATDYSWNECLGGTLDLHARLVWYQSYTRRLLRLSPVVDELARPDTLTSSVLKYRANLGASWTGRHSGFGLDAHYFYSRILPLGEWASQGSDRIKPFWQFDAFAQSDVGRWLPWKSSRYVLKGQLRVNNILGSSFPHYANEGSGSGVQPYGDWRGRVCSVSLTATF